MEWSDTNSYVVIKLKTLKTFRTIVDLHTSQNAMQVILISKPIGFSVFSVLIYKGGNSQYPEQSYKAENDRFIFKRKKNFVCEHG